MLRYLAGLLISHLTAPALEAVIPIIKKFKPESKFQTEESDELEFAWQEVLGRESKGTPDNL